MLHVIFSKRGKVKKFVQNLYLQMVEFVGLGGPIKFDTSGLRTQFEMDLMELQMGGLVGRLLNSSSNQLYFLRLKLDLGTVVTT